jgi:hypothetical protein
MIPLKGGNDMDMTDQFRYAFSKSNLTDFDDIYIYLAREIAKRYKGTDEMDELLTQMHRAYCEVFIALTE